ncbi:hypothetical protein COCOR_05409 [Corallococcus coralloides DSM 2259]|uniref:Uncharacterized protein n=1 Tax=Corallococcus coralloides (strain ATCC 25202 / DSM 2259 / NBRC 100086 / M2) TaxID=1144275 RepID=H8MXJ1_CORCM|nr:hypothetical protein [Corallococcus coralloides]AFE06354.1 hypothetical protein COCOR_05409 [Corallococcus coralloides DSM 2259]
MAGPITSILLSGVLAAAPGGDGVTFEGREASARTEQPDGYFFQGTLPFGDLTERGTGRASLSVQDRIGVANATFGDKAQLSASLRVGGTEYRVELTQAGFPPVQAMSRAPAGPLPPPPPHLIEGGVLMGTPIYGETGIGWRATTRAHAAMAVWGIGSVWRNGTLLTDSALVHAAALDAGTYSDDDTTRLLREARPGDTELVVVVWNLPPQAEPRGFIQFLYDNVSIEVEGARVPSLAVVPTTGELPSALGTLTPVLPTAFPAAVAPMSPPHFAQGTGGSGTAGTTGVATTTGTTPTAVTPGSGTVGTANLPSATAVPAEGPTTFSGTFAPSAPTNPPPVVSGVSPGSPALVGQGTFATPPTVASVSVGGFTAPQISAPDFNNFLGTTQVSPGIPATVPPLAQSSGTPTPPLVGTPAPLNTGAPTPLVGTPAPLNASPGIALPATPAPANAAPAAPAAAPAPAGGVAGPAR